jgi:hypothetical protein
LKKSAYLCIVERKKHLRQAFFEILDNKSLLNGRERIGDKFVTLDFFVMSKIGF